MGYSLAFRLLGLGRSRLCLIGLGGRLTVLGSRLGLLLFLLLLLAGILLGKQTLLLLTLLLGLTAFLLLGLTTLLLGYQSVKLVIKGTRLRLLLSDRKSVV